MRERILLLISRLRGAGVRVSVAETMDSLAAVRVAGVARDNLHAALAATLVKDVRDAPTFDRLFEEVFLAEGSAGRRRKAKPKKGGSGTGRIGDTGSLGEGERRKRQPKVSRWPQPLEGLPRVVPRAGRWQQHLGGARQSSGSPRPAWLGAEEVGEASEFLEELSRRFRLRLSRRLRRMKRGRLDFRRTLRDSISHGGAAVRLSLRGRRPRRLGLVALLDLSHSVARASELFLALVSPAARYFRPFRCFAYVDRLCEVSFEKGHIVPHGRLDLYARSDFGRVLAELTERHLGLIDANTLLLVLGDARNNRRPPRPDLMATLSRRARYVLWLNPEPAWRWDTGDSVMSRYAAHCDLLLECPTLESLALAAERVVRLNRRPGSQSSLPIEC